MGPGSSQPDVPTAPWHYGSRFPAPVCLLSVACGPSCLLSLTCVYCLHIVPLNS